LLIESIPDFQLAPVGKSKKEDFNPMCHLILEESEEDEADAEKVGG